ncbi:uncharacterized protein TNCV_4972741 [Trichonephila clavipes]|nr:uncharacterized protein TNCV_4972741 [Trichonephila clavipes]
MSSTPAPLKIRRVKGDAQASSSSLDHGLKLRGPSPSEWILTSHCSATRGLLVMDLVILKNGQMTRATPERASPLLTTTPLQREDISALDRFNVHRCPTRRVFCGTGLELETCQP